MFQKGVYFFINFFQLLEFSDRLLKSLDALNKNSRLQAGIFEEGLEEGIQKEKESVVINALNLSIDNNVIQKLTGFSFEQIETIKNKL